MAGASLDIQDKVGVYSIERLTCRTALYVSPALTIICVLSAVSLCTCYLAELLCLLHHAWWCTESCYKDEVSLSSFMPRLCGDCMSTIHVSRPCVTSIVVGSCFPS